MNFTKEQTLWFKGLSIIMVVIHHLFYKLNNSIYCDWFICGTPFWHLLSVLSKPAVAIFIILSGYGLYTSYSHKKFTIKNFFQRRFISLYIPYWICWIIFVPPVLIFTDMTFFNSNNHNGVINIILNFFGLQFWFGDYGFNSSWWFMSTIITLYLLFPLFYKTASSKWGLQIVLFFAFLICAFQPISPVINRYLFPFIAGIIIAKYKIFNISWVSGKYKRYIIFCLVLTTSFIMLFIGCYFRMRLKEAGFTTIWDSFIALSLIIILSRIVNPGKYNIMVFIGKLSYIIFIFHTFILFNLFQNFTYSFKNPLIISIFSLLICVALAFPIEKLCQYLTRFLEY